ncbi:MAG: tetratricopeptide repeat protein [Bacteroidales bacterium]|nr:tetratricopeptide repeat protein [Bacteroidales bacterium]
MDKKQINGLHKKIVRLIYSGKLFGAITEIKAQNLINQDVSDSSLKMAEDTYKLMLKYSVQGVLDPNRDKIFRQLQVSLLYSADVLRYLLMKKFYPSTIFSLTPVKCPSTMPDNENTVQWFNYIIQNTSFSPFEEEMIGSAKTSKKISWENMSLIISALTLSCVIIFDIRKFKMLVDVYLENKNQIWQRALFGIFIIAYLYNKRLRLYPETDGFYSLLKKSPKFRERYYNLVIQFIKAVDTDKVTKYVNEELMPGITKLATKITDKIKTDFKNTENFDETNPEWQNYIDNDSELYDKMSEVSKLQMEGSDVYIQTFSMLKTYPFFNKTENWFLPFSPDNQEVKNIEKAHKDENFKFMDFAQRLVKVPFFCNSDKYSLFLALNSMPESARNNLNKSFSGDINSIDDLSDEMELLHKEEAGYKILTQYVQDVYRFFKLNRDGKFLNDIFDKNFSPIGTKLFDLMISSPKERRKVAEYFFAKNYFRQSYEILKEISTQDPDFEVFQKMGYAAFKQGDIALALEDFQKAQLFNDKEVWNLKKIAQCYRKLKNPEKALEYYKAAEALDTDNLSVAIAIGRCHIDMEQYEEALKYFFKADYLDSKSTKNSRPIAWCSYKLGKYEQALKYCGKISAEDSIAEDYVLAGNAYRRLSQMDKALESYLKALEYENYTIENFEETVKADYCDIPEENNMIFDYLMYRIIKELD